MALRCNGQDHREILAPTEDRTSDSWITNPGLSLETKQFLPLSSKVKNTKC